MSKASPTPGNGELDSKGELKQLTAIANKAGPEESLKSYRLLEALRGGDAATIIPLLPTDSPQSNNKKATSETGVIVDAGGTSTPLHLAVRCAKYPTVELVLKHNPSSLNAQDSKGQTPLHIAASLNRADVVDLFLKQASVDDMVKDASGKTCSEVGGGSEVAGLISVSRSKHNESYLSLLAAYIASPTAEAVAASGRLSTAASPRSSQTPTLPSIPSSPKQPQQAPQSPSPSTGPPTGARPTHHSSPSVSAASGHVSNAAAESLYHFIMKPRSRCIDFSTKDSATGLTLLHEASKRKDLGLIKLVISRGGDVLARDRKGKLPVDLAKDERIKNVLRQAATSEGRALKSAGGGGAGVGNTGGQGQGQGYTPVGAGSGPPSMRGYLSKWTNMARGYKSRWVVLDNGTLSYYRSQDEEGKASRGSISMSVARVSPPGTDKLKFEVSNKMGKSYPSFFLKGNHPVEVMRWVDALRQNIEHTRDINTISRTGSGASTYAPSIPPTLERRSSAYKSVTEPNSVFPSRQASPAHSFGDRDGSILGDDETFAGEDDVAPRSEDFELLGNSTKTQLELTQQLLDSLVVVNHGKEELVGSSPNPNSSRPASIISNATASRQADVKEALRGSLASLGSMLDEYVDVVAQRERYFIRKYEREIDVKRLWEENMKEVAAQHAAMELELQKVGRDNTRRKRALQEVRANLAATPAVSPGPGTEDFNQDGLPESPDGPLPPPLQTSASQGSVRISDQNTLKRIQSGSLSPSRNATRIRSATVHTLNPTELSDLLDSAIIGEGDDDSEEEEEFFEAIESGQIALEPAADHEVTASEPAKAYIEQFDMSPYKGYEHLRQKLPIDNDNRPPVSLWAILKGSIGKDLTKISFPVFFNEPTSMLQRMAEDVEFSECLDQASTNQDPTKRIAYVAAFAMSNYSSTIGRIAKPFNPMLGETFEYVDLNKKYRYISEQVCHHPPISACVAQSPSWEYYGEVDAKSKFLGKSFEIRPTGIAHVKLRFPKEWAPEAPTAGPRFPGLVEEHYSWTKVTTSVSNFLFGNPIIDHFGDMVVTNHRTGDTCTLTFKPRGWRGSGACEIKGKVVDKAGKEHWDIAGKWSSQLVARKVGAGTGDLAPDAAIPSNQGGQYIRLWQNSPKPPGMPFNLTPFAITLNDTNPELKEWLPPTDCRLRPDQHAFESGKFEKANDLKSELENHQRATRRRRELGELPPHKARWFSRKKDADTGESYWEPSRVSDGQLEYWEERTRVGQARIEGAKEGKKEKEEWKEVDPIFADF